MMNVKQFGIVFLVAIVVMQVGGASEWVKLSDANNEFGLMLHGELCGGENCVFSPFSISTACSMLMTGAEGQSRSQIKRVMKYEQMEEEYIRNGFDYILNVINGQQSGYFSQSRQFQLLTASRILVDQSYQLHHNFSAIMSTYFDATTENVNFKGDPEGVRQNANWWVSSVTRGMISQFLPAGSVNPLTRAMILNAVYFKGTWEIPFLKQQTQLEEFFARGGHRKMVDTMYVMDEFRVGEVDWLESTLLELPYQGYDLCMNIILPQEGKQLSTVVEALAIAQGNTITDTVFGTGDKRLVEVHLPKFSLDFEVSLKSRLQGLGILDIFEPGLADFRRMAPVGEGELHFDEGYHKAKIQVDEEGSEAAAVTGFVVMRTSIPLQKEPVTMWINRPFMFIITHKPTKSILFMGQVVDPSPQ